MFHSSAMFSAKIVTWAKNADTVDLMLRYNKIVNRFQGSAVLVFKEHHRVGVGKE